MQISSRILGAFLSLGFEPLVSTITPREHPSSLSPSLLTISLTTLLFLLPSFLAVTLSNARVIYVDDANDGYNISSNFLLTSHDEPPTNHYERRWDTPRPCSDDIWNRAVCKGRNLVEAIHEPDQEAAARYRPPPPGMTVQSRFKNFPQEFINWGWSQYDAVNVVNEKIGWMDWHGWGIADALRGLGVSDKVVDDGDGKMLVAWMHHGPAYDDEHLQDIKGKPYKYNGKEYKFTDAHFVYAVNSEEGVILALDLKGPDYVVDWPTSKLPALRSGSDIMYGVWKAMLEGHNIASLKYYGVVGITNADTKGIIVRAVEEGKKTIKEWPGDMIELVTDRKYNEKALALLGSPTAQALGYMLVQHKEDMGKLRIVGVRVFLCNSENARSFRMACMIWILKGDSSSSSEAGSDALPP